MFVIIILTTVHLVKADQSSPEAYTRYPFPNKITVYRSLRQPKANNEKMQYAPLLLNTPENNYDYTATIKYDKNIQNDEEDISHLEPRYNEYFGPKKPPSFVPGYNLELQRILEKESRTEQNVKVKNHLPHILEYNIERENAGIPFKSNNIQHNVITIQKDKPDFKYNEEGRLNRNNIKESDTRYPKNLLDLESKGIQPYLVVKTPRLHLNVARAYNFAFIPHKALPHINELLLRKIPSLHEKNLHKTFLASHSNKNNCHSPQPY
ncbi:uncharacterized protein LOC123708146 [Pieris brassicae]|uniref:uncharacterized protein LOC123708146 n=1 Tax=Pieris brassicae TaxID=7116 RepID=UPI001E66268C|nr:uncharacterized protein LOC123708146 [Pieris brassicae]